MYQCNPWIWLLSDTSDSLKCSQHSAYDKEHLDRSSGHMPRCSWLLNSCLPDRVH